VLKVTSYLVGSDLVQLDGIQTGSSTSIGSLKVTTGNFPKTT